MSVDMKEREKEAERLARALGYGWTKQEVTPHTSIFHIVMTLEEAQRLEERLGS